MSGVSILGLVLIAAAIVLFIMGGAALWIIGLICLAVGVGALWLGWVRKRQAAA